MQALQLRPDAPVGQHRFQPEHLLARTAVLDDVDAPGVGCKVAADLAAALRGHAERQQPVVVCRGALRGRQRAAGLDGHRIVGGINGAHAIHARERQQDLVGATDRAATQAGIAPLRYDGDAILRAGRNDAGQLVGIGRSDDESRVAGVIATPFAEIGLPICGIVDEPALTDDGQQCRAQRVRHQPLTSRRQLSMSMLLPQNTRPTRLPASVSLSGPCNAATAAAQAGSTASAN